MSVQASIINLLDDIRRETGTSFLFIAHDLAVVEHISSRILVMYLGHIVESAPSRELVAAPSTRIAARCFRLCRRWMRRGGKRIVLPGDVPSPLSPPGGCPFHPRCPRAQERCRRERPVLRATAADGRAAVPVFSRKRALLWRNEWNFLR
ncbi:MAG: ABC transporter ATP-binding protein [Lentisphaeria bacterium]|nr:MAG: ABC transporter ATP-binding protein [Lentisphaeria bacterium]